MSNPYFQFKQFTVWHDKCAMKVGTDGVLLGAWTSVESAHRILDIGTGTGLVALMLAQRSLPDANIVALEIDEAAVGQARENIIRSPWKERVEVVQADFRKYRSSDKFDVMVSNPAFLVDSLECPDRQRAAARLNDSLTYEDLLEGVSGLLTENGFFTVVIPADVAEKILRFARAAQAVATMRGKSYLSMGSVSMGIAGSIVNPDFFQEYLGMRNESIDLTEIIRRMAEGIYD